MSSPANTNDSIIVEPSQGPASASVIWLHGLGADGHDFEPIVPALGLDDLALRFVFPHAPVRPVTVNGGMAMRAWYDIYSFDRDGPQDAEGVKESAHLLEAYIEAEQQKGIQNSRIIVAGFSQGGAIALYAGLHHAQKLGGIMALSTYIPLSDTFSTEQSRTSPPIFMAHGTQDAVLPIALGTASRDFLQSLSIDVEWHEYDMAHNVSEPEILDISRWLPSVLS